MANAPHGGILKVSSPVSNSSLLSLLIQPHFQDLVARDAPIQAALKAEASTLPDVVLTDVRTSLIATDMH